MALEQDTAKQQEVTARVGPKEGSEPMLLIKDLSVLPPLQKEGTLLWNESVNAISLPPLRAEEPVQSLIGALTEIVGYAHLTNYRLVLVEEDDNNKRSKYEAPPTVSLYTGPNAIVSVPARVKSLESFVPHLKNGKPEEVVLDEYSDLLPILEKGLKDGCSFRIVLERYTPASVRDQVTRVRFLLDGNAPSVAMIYDDEEEPAVEEEKTEDDKEESSKATEERISVCRPIPTAAKNLKDFYYLASGEEEYLYETTKQKTDKLNESTDVPMSPSKKKKKGKKKAEDTSDEDESNSKAPGGSFEETERRLNELDEKMRVKCTVRFSGFHPPPRYRCLMGDLAYLEVTPPCYPDEPVLNITAVPTGFYVNRSSVLNGSFKFDPSPASKSCFSHALLDCLLQASDSLRAAYETALEASKKKTELTTFTGKANPLYPLFRVAVRGDYGGYKRTSTMLASRGVDLTIFRPSWLVPVPKDSNAEDAWNHNSLHDYDPARTEGDLSNTFGLDMTTGPPRDWNEELQGAREMPVSTQLERIERARLINKVMSDFGEAAVVGAMSIFNGFVTAMNPNEPTRSHVYLHNNIFFSRAIDSGIETFKVGTGDRCARKGASRDAQCMASLFRLDIPDLHTLATVLVDYMGTRFICQSVVAGILTGEQTHRWLYGAVEANMPLAWDKDMHELMERTIGRSFMIATRSVPTRPLTDERMAEIEECRTETPFVPERLQATEDEDLPEMRTICGPIEAKGIEGADKRKYILEVTRLTPRDANWVPKSMGGTGVWEEQASNGKKSFVPENLDDEELMMALLRPELVTLICHRQMTDYLSKKMAEEDENEKNGGDESAEKKEVMETDTSATKESAGNEPTAGADVAKDEKPKPKKRELTPEDEEHLKSIRLNINLFLPHMKPVTGVDSSLEKQVADDAERIRGLSLFLWSVILPSLTNEIRAGKLQVPQDGRTLTDVLHQRGINCRYLGQLASLARAAEENDRDIAKELAAALKAGQEVRVPRMKMPLCWLEMLECEMLARSAKHVLDGYLAEHGGTAARQPAQTIASFLSALMSTSEETAGETEIRLGKEVPPSDGAVPDEDDFNALTICDTGGEGDALPAPIHTRNEVWDDIERDLGRRFRYTLTLYNQSGTAKSRALYAPLLRRVCERTGVRLVAKNYSLGGKCLCSAGSTSGGRITDSYPISPLDIVEVVPLVKHSAAQGSGFIPCSPGPNNIMLPSLNLVLPDAKLLLESAHHQYEARSFPVALELAQDAAALYQRVTDSPIHHSIYRCVNLSSAILFAAGEHQLAIANASKALAISVQLGGFDCVDAVACHSTMSHMLNATDKHADAVKHLRAALYLEELLAGPRYPELSSDYFKLGNYYQVGSNYKAALRCFKEASNRAPSDRLMEGMISKSTSMLLGILEQYKEAIDMEKRAYDTFAILVGTDNELTKSSHMTLQDLTKRAVEQNSRQVTESKQREEAAAADAIASQIVSEEEEEEKKSPKRKTSKKKKHKK